MSANKSKDLKASTIRSLFWKLFEQGGASVITLLIQIVMARLLTPDEFGELAIMLVFVNVGNVIVQSGLNTAVIQAPSVTERDFSTVFWMSLALSLAFYVTMFVATPYIASFYGTHAIIAPLRVLLLILIVNAYNSIQEAIVARGLEFEKTFRATVAAGVLSGFAGVASAVAGVGIWALVIQQLSYQLVKCAVLAIQVPWKPRATFDAQRASMLFGFGWKLLCSGLLDQVYQGLADLIIGRQFTKGDLGYVSQGKKYPAALGVLLDGAIQPVMLSAVSRVQESREDAKRLARRALKTSTFLIVPAMGIFALTAEPIVLLLLGEKWLPAVPFLQVYCLIYAMLPIHTTNLQVLNGMGRSDIFLKLEVIKNIIGLVILSFTALVTRDLYMIVAGYVLSAVIATFVNAEPNKRVIGYAYLEQIRDICPAFILTAIAMTLAAPLGVLGLSPLVLIVAQLLVVVAVYLLVAYIAKVEELTYLLSTVREMLGRRAK